MERRKIEDVADLGTVLGFKVINIAQPPGVEQGHQIWSFYVLVMLTEKVTHVSAFIQNTLT